MGRSSTVPVPSLSKRGVETLQARIQTVHSYSQRHRRCLQVLRWFSEHPDAELEHHVYEEEGDEQV